MEEALLALNLRRDWLAMQVVMTQREYDIAADDTDPKRAAKLTLDLLNQRIGQLDMALTKLAS